MYPITLIRSVLGLAQPHLQGGARTNQDNREKTMNYLYGGWRWSKEEKKKEARKDALIIFLMFFAWVVVSTLEVNF